jgi:predicted 3-demethylubiquinone-9 3-methyltransferase (glyoxalase superfamily)
MTVYCLRTTLVDQDNATLWRTYIMLTELESVFRPDPAGPALMAVFTLAGTPYQAMNMGNWEQSLNDSVSISVVTRDQDETDRLWNALLADGGKENCCGWLKDRFGLSWQIVPEILPRLLGQPDPQAAKRAQAAMIRGVLGRRSPARATRPPGLNSPCSAR